MIAMPPGAGSIAASTVAAVAAGGLVLLASAAVRPRRAARTPAPPSIPARRGRAPARRSRRDAATSVDDLIEVLDHVVRAMRTGHSLSASLAHALRERPRVLATTARALAAGSRLSDALDVRVRAGSDLALAVHALVLADRTGGPAVDAVERTATVLRERRAWQAERRAQAAQARLGASVMTVVPLGFAIWSALASARVRDVYATSGLALALALAGVVLNATGWWWMRRVTLGGDR